VYPELDTLTLDALIAYFGHKKPIDGWRYAASFYTEVGLLLARSGQEGAHFLFAQIERDKKRKIPTSKLRGVLFGLSQLPDAHDATSTIFLLYLHDKRPLIVADALDCLRHGNIILPLSTLVRYVEATSAYVKGAALRYISHLYPKLAKEYLLPALHDAHYIVRENAVDELAELNDPQFIPYIQPLVQDPHPHVRQAAQTTIADLADN